MQSNKEQPFYDYRDESLSALSQGDPIAIQRRQRFIWLRFFVKLFFVVVTIGCAMILPVHYSAAYAAYQQGSCTITDKQVQEYDSRDKHGNITSRSYGPVFSYTVHIANDRQVVTNGFDGPTSVHYYDIEEAQAVADRYTIDQRVSCWYNPNNPTHAFIIFYGYSSSNAAGAFFLGLFFLGIFAVTVYFLFDWTVWRLYALAKRGVLVYGRVLRNEERRNKSRKYIVSVVGFQTAEEANKERHIVISKQLQIGSPVRVCYDPFYPRYYRRYDWPVTGAYIAGIVLIGVLLIVAFIVMMILWLIP